MATKQNPGASDCYDAALPDEPMFTLLARDPSAPHVVRQWAYERERAITRGEKPESDAVKVIEARACAAAMEEWRKQNDGAWRLPSKLLAKEVEYWRESCRILAAELKDAKT